jgi:hypothetical protein
VRLHPLLRSCEWVLGAGGPLSAWDLPMALLCLGVLLLMLGNETRV